MKTIVLCHPDTAMEHVQDVAPNPTCGHPLTHVWRCFVHPSGKINAGIWSCESGSFEIFSHTSTEMCTILEGEATIEHEDGSKVSVASGDSFVIPHGAHTLWHVPTYVRKAFICHSVESDLVS